MKQNINAEMLLKLSDDKIKKLADLVEKKTTIEKIKEDREWYEKTKGANGYTWLVEDICKKCTIGKMIEMLESYDENLIDCIFKTPDGEWSCCTCNDYEGYTRSHKELCDELWEIMKSIL